MAGGGSITVTVNLKLNILGAEALKGVETRLRNLRAEMAKPITVKAISSDKSTKGARSGAAVGGGEPPPGKTRRELQKKIGPLSEVFKQLEGSSNRLSASFNKLVAQMQKGLPRGKGGLVGEGGGRGKRKATGRSRMQTDAAFLASSRDRAAEANLRNEISRLKSDKFRRAQAGVQAGGLSRKQQQQMFSQAGIQDPNQFRRLSESKISGMFRQEEKARAAAIAKAQRSRAAAPSAPVQKKGAFSNLFGSDAKGDRGGFGGRLKSVAEFAVAARVVQTAFSAIAKSVQTIVGVDAELKELNKVLATSGEELEGLRVAAVATGKEFGTSVTTVLKGFKVFAQQGLQQEDIIKRGKAVALAQNVSTLSTEDAAETVTAGLKVFGSEVGGSAEKLIDSFVAVESQNAVTASDLSEVVKRVGIAAKNAGTTFDELNAITTVIQESTRAGGQRISRALKFTFKNIFDPTREKTLKDVGVSTKTSTGDLRDATDVLGDLSTKWVGLNKAQRRNVAVTIGGTRFQNEFMAMMENFGKVSEVTAQSQDSVGTSAERNAIIMQSMSKRASKAGASFEGLASSLGGGIAGPVSAGLKAAEKLFDVLTSISDMEFPGLKALQEATGTAGSEATGKTGDLAGNALTAALLFGGGRKAGLNKGAGQLLFGAQRGKGQSMKSAAKGMVGFFKSLGPKILSGIKVAFTGFSIASIFTGISGAFSALSVFITGTVVPALITFGLPLLLLAGATAAAVKAFNIFTESAEERDQRTGLNAERKKVKEQVKVFKPLGDSFKTLEKQKQELKDPKKLGETETAKRLEGIELREKASRKSLRNAVIDNAEELTKTIPKLEITPDLEVKFRGEDISKNTDAAAKLSKSINARKGAEDAAITAQKALNKLRDPRDVTGEQKRVLDALRVVRQRGGATMEDTFVRFDAMGNRMGEATAEEFEKQQKDRAGRVRQPITQEQIVKRRGLKAAELRDITDPGLLAKARSQIAGPLGDAAVGAARGGRFSFLSAENRMREGDVSGKKDRKLREQLINQRILATREQGGELTRKSIDAIESEVGDMDIDDVISKVFQQSLGARANVLAQDAITQLDGKEGRDLAGIGKGDKDLRAKELSELAEGTVIKADKAKEGSTGLFVKFGNQIAEVMKDGTANLVGSAETVFADFQGSILNFRSVIGEFASIVTNIASTGFGAGSAVLGKDFDSGATTLKDMSNQVAGTFQGTDKREGAIFNKGLRQFLLAAEKNREKFEKDRSEFEDIEGPKDKEKAKALREQQKLVTASSLIAKSAEAFGVAAKAIESASRNFRLFQEQRKIRQDIQVDPTTDALFPGGFAKLELGRSESELSPQEKAQRRFRPAALKLEGLQVQQKLLVGQQNTLAAAKDDLVTLIKSISAEDIISIDVANLPNILSGNIGGIRNSEDIEGILKGAVLDKADRPSLDRAEVVREDVLEKLTRAIVDAMDKGRATGKATAAEILPLQQFLRAATALEQLSTAATNSQTAFESVKAAGTNLDKALSSRFNRQGSRAQRAFTAPAGARRDQLSQMPNTEQLNEFQQRRRMANLLASPAVQQGRQNVFNEQRQRVAPISAEERNARLQDIRLDEKRAKRSEREQEGKGLFNVRKSQLGEQLNLVRNIKKLNISEQFNREIEKIELGLANIQTQRPGSFFSRSGKFNEGSFGALSTLGKDLEKSFQRLAPAELKKLSAPELIDKSKQIGAEKSAKALGKLAETGLLSDKDLISANQKGLLSDEQVQKAKEARFEPIVTVLSSIDKNTAAMVTLLGGKGTTAADGADTKPTTRSKTPTTGVSTPESRAAAKKKVVSTAGGATADERFGGGTSGRGRGGQGTIGDLLSSAASKASTFMKKKLDDATPLISQAMKFFTRAQERPGQKAEFLRTPEDAKALIAKEGGREESKLPVLTKDSFPGGKGGPKDQKTPFLTGESQARKFAQTEAMFGKPIPGGDPALRKLKEQEARLAAAQPVVSGSFAAPSGGFTKDIPKERMDMRIANQLGGGGIAADTMPNVETRFNNLGQKIRGSRLTQFEADTAGDPALAGQFRPLSYSGFASQGPNGEAIPVNGGQIARGEDTGRNPPIPDEVGRPELGVSRPDVLSAGGNVFSIPAIQRKATKVDDANEQQSATVKKKEASNNEASTKAVTYLADKGKKDESDSNKSEGSGKGLAADLNAFLSDLKGVFTEANSQYQKAGEVVSGLVKEAITSGGDLLNTGFKTVVDTFSTKDKGVGVKEDEFGAKLDTYIIDEASKSEAILAELQEQKEKVGALDEMQLSYKQFVDSTTQTLEERADEFSNLKSAIDESSTKIESRLSAAEVDGRAKDSAITELKTQYASLNKTSNFWA